MNTKSSKALRVGDEAVQKATGKDWATWFALLDKAGARQMTHQEIVAVASKHGAGPWWQQMVTVGYEQDRGLRKKHEKPEGFQMSRSKTLAVAVAKVFAAFKDLKRRATWLADPDFTIRKATANKSLRLTWGDGKTTVEVMFYPKGAAKTQVTVQHNKLPSAKAAERMKKYWGEQLERLARVL